MGPGPRHSLRCPLASPPSRPPLPPPGVTPARLNTVPGIEHRLTRTMVYVRTLFVKRISFEGVEMTRIQVAVTGRPAAPAGYPRRWLAAIIMIVGALMDMIDVTIVNVALPTIRRDLHASATQLEWVISGYMLAFAAGLIIAGNLGDRLGRKRIFLLGVGFFGLASLAAGLSGSGAELIAARVVQGAAAAAMAPQVLATFRAIFGREERGKAFGIYGAMLGFASAIGLVLGGLLTSANLFGWEWRSVFYVNIPVAVAALIAGARFVAGMQGFFIAFALWLQAGEHFSPLKAGLTAVAFSVGSFIAAPVAVPLAQKAGRRILAGGAVLMVAGIGGVALAAPHVGLNGSPWPIVPGLVVAGAGLALLVIPLVNVVLAAVPAEVAGGASGLFSTAQQLGGALGVALLGSVFFGYLNGHSFEAALVHTAPYAMGAFALCGVLALLLPRTAVSEEALTES